MIAYLWNKEIWEVLRKRKYSREFVASKVYIWNTVGEMGGIKISQIYKFSG